MISLNTPAKQRRFRKIATQRAAHHAKSLVETVPVVVDALMRYGEPGSLQSSSHNRKMTGSGFATLGGRKLYACFHRPTKAIVVREGKGGKILLSFDSRNSASSIDKQIKALRRG